MSSTYSPDLRIQLLGSGDEAGTWGTTTNNTFAYLFEAAIAGYQSVTITSTSQALTYIYGSSSTAADNQSVYAMLRFTGASAATAIYAPPASKQYIIKNDTSYAITIYNSTVIGNTTAAGTGVSIGSGLVVQVWSDGTNFYNVDYNSAKTGTGSVVFSNSPTITTPTLVSPSISTPTISTYGNIKALFETATITASAPSSTTNFDVVTQAVQYYTTNAANNFTLNIRGDGSTSLNSLLSTGQSVTIALMVTNGATAYYPTAYQIDGTSVTPKWQAGYTPVGGDASSINVYTLAIVKTASATYTVLASQSKFA